MTEDSAVAHLPEWSRGISRSVRTRAISHDFRVNAVRARWAVGVSMRSSAIESGRMLTACDRTTEPIISIKSRAETTIRHNTSNSPSSFAYGRPRMIEDSAVAHLPKWSRGISRTIRSWVTSHDIRVIIRTELLLT